MFTNDRYELELDRIRAMALHAHPIGDVKHIGLLDTATVIDEIFGDVLRATNPGADPALLPLIRGRLALARFEFSTHR